MLARIGATLGDLIKEYNKYDPVEDGKGGFPMRGGSVTKPGGHYTEMKQLQRRLKNLLKEYVRDCLNNDDNNKNCPRVYYSWSCRNFPKPVIPESKPPSMWEEIDWGYAGQQTGTVLAIGGLLLLTVGQPETCVGTLPAIGKLAKVY